MPDQVLSSCSSYHRVAESIELTVSVYMAGAGELLKAHSPSLFGACFLLIIVSRYFEISSHVFIDLRHTHLSKCQHKRLPSLKPSESLFLSLTWQHLSVLNNRYINPICLYLDAKLTNQKRPVEQMSPV